MTNYYQITPLGINDREFLAAIFGDQAHLAQVSIGDNFATQWWGDVLPYWDETSQQKRYYCVSEFHPSQEQGGVLPRRRKELFKRQRVLVVDDIEEKVSEDRFASWPAPSFKMYTSPGSQQWGWILNDQEEAYRIDYFVDQVVDLYFEGKDPGMKGVTRIAKLPSSWNTKDSKRESSGEYSRSKLYEWNPGRTFSLAELASAAGIDLSKARTGASDHGIPEEWPEDSPVVQAIEAGIIHVAGDKGDGQLFVECPNRHNHTVDNDGDRSGLLYMHADGSGGYKCHHGGCEGFKFPQFLQAHRIKDAHDAWRKQRFGTNAPGSAPDLAEIFKDVPAPPAANQHEASQRAPHEVTFVVGEVEAPPPADDQIREWISRLGTPQLSQLNPLMAKLVEAFPHMNALQRDVAAKDMREQFQRMGTNKVFQEALAKALANYRRLETAARAQMAQIEKARGAGSSDYKPLSAQPMEIDYPFPSPGDNRFAPAIAHAENLKAMCAYHNISIRYNIMTHGVEISIPNLPLLEDEADNLAVYHLSDIARASFMSADGLKEKILQVAVSNAYHPVLEWLSAQPAWDGRDYIGEIVALLDTPSPELLRKYLENWMRQGVVAARNSYGKTPPRNVLVFTGAQYIGKTTFFRLITPGVPGGFAEGLHLNPSDRDSLKQSVVSFTVELGELDATFRKADIALLKAHISKGTDRFRLPYATTESTWPRRTIYCATVNDSEFLVDKTGNSRWNVVEVNGIDLDQLRVLHATGVIAGAWKQAEAAIDEGQLWYFMREEVEAMEAHLNKFMRINPIEDGLASLFDWYAPEEDWVKMTNHQIGDVLRHAGLTVNVGIGPLVKSFMAARGMPQPPGVVKIDGKTHRGFLMPPRDLPIGKARRHEGHDDQEPEGAPKVTDPTDELSFL